jgi:hypothetical protein
MGFFDIAKRYAGLDAKRFAESTSAGGSADYAYEVRMGRSKEASSGDRKSVV